MNFKQFLVFVSVCVLVYSCSCSTKLNDYFSGVVVDEFDNPIEGVLVTEDFVNEYYPINEIKTNKDGYFKLNRKDNFLADLIFSKEGYRTDTIPAISTMHGEIIVYSSLITQDSSKIVLEKNIHYPITLDSIAGVYTGNSVKGIKCAIRINSDNTVNFVYNTDKFYTEYEGTIKQFNNSLYKISAKKVFHQSMMKTSHYNEPIPSIFVDQTIADNKELHKFEITYSNGHTESLELYPSKSSFQLDMPVDQSLFNEKEGSNYFIVSIKRNNPITNKPLSFKIKYNCAAVFNKAYEDIDFNIVIDNGKLRLIGEPPPKIGSFELHSIK